MSSNKKQYYWLLTCAAMVLIMAMIGAATRLTESGLSMVEWRPLIGALPPLSEKEWFRVFSLYQQTPEYIKVHSYMNLDDFKSIFLWEWFHRLWGRLIGLVFLVPFLYFLLTKQIKNAQIKSYSALFLLGALQGFIGWYMVKSGLIDKPAVSHYRLALHLLMAAFIYSALLWAAWNVKDGEKKEKNKAICKLWLLPLFLVFITLLWGAFTAGLKAGYLYNSFPLMGGKWLPDDLWIKELGLLNLLENHTTVQFTHRYLAIFTYSILLLFWAHKKIPGPKNAIFIMVNIQLLLGIATLLTQVNILLATLHQGGAFILLGMILYALKGAWQQK